MWLLLSRIKACVLLLIGEQETVLLRTPDLMLYIDPILNWQVSRSIP